MARKFIINDGNFLMSASIEFHRELSKDHSKTRGGGRWELIENRLYLYGTSFDFGQARKEDIIEAIKNENIPFRMHEWDVYWTDSDSFSKSIATGNFELIKKGETNETGQTHSLQVP